MKKEEQWLGRTSNLFLYEEQWEFNKEQQGFNEEQWEFKEEQWELIMEQRGG